MSRPSKSKAKHGAKTPAATKPEGNSAFEVMYGDAPVGADRPSSLAAAFEEPASTVEVAVAELDPARFITARVHKVNAATVTAYAARMREFDAFPPIELFKDDEGRFWLGDGVHRVEAAKANGATTILARVSDGGERAALLHAANANSAHGLRRTTADKRRAVELVYRVHPEWLGENSDPEGTDRQVAAKCGVDHKTVGAVKRALKARGEIPQSADGEGESAVKPVSKRKPKRPIKPDRAVKLARRELDRVFKDWPLADDRALFFRTVNDWLAENESAITKAPTAEAAE